MNQIARTIVIACFTAPLLLAAGCARPPASSPTPATYVPPKGAPSNTGSTDAGGTTVEAAGLSVIARSKPLNGDLIFGYNGAPPFTFTASGTIAGTEGISGPALGVIDLGSAVQDPGAKYAPTRMLEVYLVDADDPRMDGCFFSGDGWKNGVSPKKGGSPISKIMLCVTTTEDAAVGNRYNVRAYATPVDGRYIVFQFIVHSLVCENYPNPEEQCIPYDETRDMGDFEKIAGSIMQTFSIREKR